MGESEAMQAYIEAFISGLRPDPVLTVSAWADKYRILPPKASAEPGPWRTDRTPYLREIMDCLSADSPIEEVVFVAGSQVGKTECGNNWIGYIIDHAPAPTIAVQPTVELAKRYSQQRIDTLIDYTPRVREKIGIAKSRDAKNKQLSKEFPGGILIMTGANSAVGLRSMPAQYSFQDEIDAWPGDVDGEGDPSELIAARQRTFARRKRLKTSTPTTGARSRIMPAYMKSDQRRFYLPCPHCGAFQKLVWSQVKWKEIGLPAREAVYVCVECGAFIENHQKTGMLSLGEWRKENPNTSGRVAGFHLSSLYSPVGWLSWGEIAEKWEESEDNLDKMRVFINTVLGETWQEKGEAPEWRRLYDRRERYKIGTVPGGALLTAGVDVQKDRLEVEIVAWGRGGESWSVESLVIPGDTSTEEILANLDKLLERTWPHVAGVEIPLSRMAVDSGYNTQVIYNWARRWPMNRVICIKGQDKESVLLGQPSPVDVSQQGRRIARGYKVWPVGVSLAKSELYARLRLERPTDEALAAGGKFPAGYCHFPEYGENFFEQITAEQLVGHRTKGGYVKLSWELIQGRRNEKLDCRIYARAAASACGMDRFRDHDWDALEYDTLGRKSEPEPEKAAGPKPGGAAPPMPKVPEKPPPSPPKREPYAARKGWIKR